MESDPGETRNLARDSAHAAALAEHRKILREWEARLDPMRGNPHGERWRKIASS